MADKEYIAREDIFPNGVFFVSLEHPEKSLDELINRIHSLPAADVVEVVRCKDCRHYLNDTDYCQEHNKGYCRFDDMIKSEKHFCADGVRKGGSNDEVR